MNKNVRLNKNSSDTLNELTNITNLSKTEIVEIALENLKRDLFFKKANKIYESFSIKELQEQKDEQSIWEEASLKDYKND